MVESSEGEEDVYMGRGMVGKGSGEIKGGYIRDLEPYKSPVIEGYEKPVLPGTGWPASVPPAPMAHFPPYASKNLSMEETIEEIESEEAQQYEDELQEEKMKQEQHEYADQNENEEENEDAEDDSETDSGYTLSQETARFNLQQMPVGQQIGIQMFAPDRSHLLPPRPGAAMQERAMFPAPNPLEPFLPHGHQTPQGYLQQGYYSGPYQEPIPPVEYPVVQYTHPQHQLMRSGTQPSLSSQHAHSSMHNQSSSSIVDKDSPFQRKGSKGLLTRKDFVTSELQEKRRQFSTPLINGIPFESPVTKQRDHDRYAEEPEQGENIGFIDATQGKRGPVQYQRGPYLQYQYWHDRHYSMQQGTFQRPTPLRPYHRRDDVVEIAHLSMNMLRNDPYGRRTRRMPPPTHERKFTVPSHNLSESYKEKHDVVKENNFKNTSHLHGNRLSTKSQHETIAGSSVSSLSNRTITKHDFRGKANDNKGTTVISDGRGHNGNRPVTNQTELDGMRDSVGRGLESPRSVDSERGRMLKRPQSDRSFIRSNSEISGKQGTRGSENGSRRSRPSSAVEKASGSWTDIKRPVSAQSQRGSDHIVVKRPSQVWSVSDGRPDTERPGTLTSVSDSGQGKADTPTPCHGLVSPSSVRSRSSASSSVLGKKSEEDRPAVRSDGEVTGNRPSSGKTSQNRPGSGKSHSSIISARNNNNNNRENVRSDSARTYYTDGVETLERTPRKGSIVVIEKTDVSGQEEFLHATACDDNSANCEDSGEVVKTGRNENTDTKDYEGCEISKQPEEKEIVDGTTLTNGWELENESVTGWEQEMGEDRKATEHYVNTSENDLTDSKSECEGAKQDIVEDRMVEGNEDKNPGMEMLEDEKREHSQEQLEVREGIYSEMLQNTHIKKETPRSGQNYSLVNNCNNDQYSIETNESDKYDAKKPNVVDQENTEVSNKESENLQSEKPEAIDLGDLAGWEENVKSKSPEAQETVKSNGNRSSSRRLSGRSSCTRGSEKPPSSSRPISARSRPESARSVRRIENTSLPDSARSVIKPMSSGSSKSRPASARSMKSCTSGIEFIDNLSRRSSVHISSEFKSNALKNQANEIEKEELSVKMEGPVGESVEGRRSSRVRAKNSRKVTPNMLNNGSIPDLRQKVEKNK